MRPLRMRKMLLGALLLLAITMTLVCLALVRFTMHRQIQQDLEIDTQRSSATFANLQAQRRRLLTLTAGLMADLPSLKALMSARDPATIADGGAEFWRVSGSRFLALSDQGGRLVALYNEGAPLPGADVIGPVGRAVAHPGRLEPLRADGRLLEILSAPIYFGDGETAVPLGSVTVGYTEGLELAQEVSEAAAAEVSFVSGREVLATTLSPAHHDALIASIRAGDPVKQGDLHLGKEHFLARVLPLAPSQSGGTAYLLILKSYERSEKTLRELDLGIALIGLLGLTTGAVLAAAMSRVVTRPLESLLAGTRALGAGDFDYPWQEAGTAETRELGVAFRSMAAQIERAQRDLLVADRMATIGRMASSISHDLRHYLTSMYANAEFLSMSKGSAAARAEMMEEVKSAVLGMTELLDSMLVFGRVDTQFAMRAAQVTDILRRSVERIRKHPDAQDVLLHVTAEEMLHVQVDPQEIDRAVYNLLLNACQAARTNAQNPQVWLKVDADAAQVYITVEDNGCGVPVSIRDRLFQPFVSAGKEHGTGLGLALSRRIMELHDGNLRMQESHPGRTVFSLSLPLLHRSSDPVTHQAPEEAS